MGVMLNQPVMILSSFGIYSIILATVAYGNNGYYSKYAKANSAVIFFRDFCMSKLANALDPDPEARSDKCSSLGNL